MAEPLRRRLVVLSLVLVLLLALGALLSAYLNPARGPAFLGVPESVPQAADKTLGINTDLGSLDDISREEVLAAIQAGGFRWLRQRFPWEVIEPEPGRYEWADWDKVVEAADRHSIQLIAVLDGSPRWARATADADNALAPPVQTRDFGAFASAFAARYQDQIHFYQIWEEPNIAPHWGAREVDPEAYVCLLREGAIQIRSADPGASILAAAMAPNVESGGANMSELRFLEAMYERGAAPWFDIVAIQLYDFGEPVDEPPRADRLTWARAALVRDVMVAHDDVASAAWAVSFGLAGMRSEVIEASVEQARTDWPWLGPMLWAAWSPQDIHGSYSATGVDGQRGGVVETLTAMAWASDLAWPGVYTAEHASGKYEGDWRVSSLGADIGRTGDRLLIRFRGTRIDLAVRRGDYRAFLFVRVDGQPANALPHDSDSNAYVVLYDPLGEEDSVTLARRLSDGEHVAEIVAERGWGQWAVVGWTISREGNTRQVPLTLSLGAASLAVLGLVAALTWRDRYVLMEGSERLLNLCRAVDFRIALVLTAGSAAAVYITVGLLPSLVSLVVLGLLLLVRPETGIPVICMALPFYQLGKPLGGKVFSMVEILVMLTALSWLVNQLGRGQRLTALFPPTSWRLTPIDMGVVGLLVLGGLSLLWAEHAREAAREFRTVVLEAALFYGLVRAMVRDERGVRTAVGAWLMGGSAIAVIGIVQWLSRSNVITAGEVWRVRGFYGSPNNLALYLDRVFPLAIAVALWARGSVRKLLSGLAALVMGLALVLTYSRGAWLLGVPASALFLVAAGIRRRTRARWLLVTLVCVAMVAAVLVILLVGTGSRGPLLDTSEGTTFFRLRLWQSSLTMIRDHPVLGVGLDNFLYEYRTRYVQPVAWEEFDLSHPHNIILDFWLRLGILGPLVLGWLLVAFFRAVRKALASKTQTSSEATVLGAAAGVVAFAAHGLVDNAFFLVDLAFAFMLAMAMVQNLSDGIIETEVEMKVAG